MAILEKAMPTEMLEKETCTFEALDACVAQGSLYAIIDAIAHDDVSGFAAELASQATATEAAPNATEHNETVPNEIEQSSPVPELGASELVTSDAVPHLLKISPRFWRFLKRDIWQQSEKAAAPSWGLFFQLNDPNLAFSDLVKHWRYWYQVELPNNNSQDDNLDNIKSVFRFYDPRLIDAFLDVSNDAEKTAFFGPVSRLLLPQADGSARIYKAPELDVPKPNVPKLNAPKFEAAKLEAPVLYAAVLPDTHPASLPTIPEHNKNLKPPFIMRDVHMTAMELRRLEQRIPAYREYLDTHFDDEFKHFQITDRNTFIRHGLRHATQHGFFSEQATLGWLSLQLLHGPDFATSQPWAVNILKEKQHTIGDEDRADRLINTGFDKATDKNKKETA
jgi:uncharacterized protein DUF4123